MQTEIIQGYDPRQLEMLKVNARFMKYEVFQRLVANIRRDGVLTSVPLCIALGTYAPGDEPQRDEAGEIVYEILSGNHRVKAAIVAELPTITIQVVLDPMPREQRIAIQLSHNALTGEDDPAVLQQLYKELDIDWREYAALDDRTLKTMQEVQIGNLAEANLVYQSLGFVFLPHEIELIKETFAAARKLTPGDLFLARFGEYDRFLDMLEDVGAAYMVNNASSQLMLFLDLASRHLGELREGWYDELHGTAKHDKTAPLTSLFETTAIPTRWAVPIARALKEGRERKMSPGEAMAKMAELYLASLKEK